MSLPLKVIQGLSVRDYAYQWICGHCEMHQWCSGGKGIDSDVIAYCKRLIREQTTLFPGPDDQENKEGLIELLQYLIHNEGAPAETYVPDQWTKGEKCGS